MTKLARSSVTRGFIAVLLQSKATMFHSHAKAKQQHERALAHVAREYSMASPRERYATGASSLNALLEYLHQPFLNGDNDLLEAYVKFSVFKNPSLPLAVNNLRIATGKYRVINVLTKEHLDIHDRIVLVFKDLISDGEDGPRSVMDRKFNKLAVFAFTNMEHADDILRIAETRKLVIPKDIAVVLDNETIMAPLMDGIL
jgi:hypothetical protein